VAVAFFGLEATRGIAAGGAFNLGFVSMPMIFTKIPAGQLFGFLWFALLFFAGITSSVAMANPVISFIRDEFGVSHKKATGIVGAMTFVCIQPVVFLLGKGYLDEMDFWAGTFGLVVFALIEIIIFAWIFGMDKAWNEITAGAELKVPRVLKPILQYVTPAFLAVIMVAWFIQDAWPTLLMQHVPEGHGLAVHGARLMMTALLAAFCWMIWAAWKRHGKQEA
jgi:SNF family Na+-dependent transporter